MPVVIGLTGGIGCGKSAVEREFNSLGVPSVDMDVVARNLVNPGSEALASIHHHFEQTIPNILLPDSSLNRRALREHIFDHPSDKVWLERLMHPLIREQTQQLLAGFNNPYSLLVSPLLFEKNISHNVSIVVDIPEALQLARTCERDNANSAQIAKIIAEQMPRHERLRRADYVIDNSTTRENTSKQVVQIHDSLNQRFR